MIVDSFSACCGKGAGSRWEPLRLAAEAPTGAGSGESRGSVVGACGAIIELTKEEGNMSENVDEEKTIRVQVIGSSVGSTENPVVPALPDVEEVAREVCEMIRDERRTGERMSFGFVPEKKDRNGKTIRPMDIVRHKNILKRAVIGSLRDEAFLVWAEMKPGGSLEKHKEKLTASTARECEVLNNEP